jgi:hypothetical protein
VLLIAFDFKRFAVSLEGKGVVLLHSQFSLSGRHNGVLFCNKDRSMEGIEVFELTY